MADRLKQIPTKILEWWNKFTAKQKTVIISITAGVAVALAVLIAIFTTPKYETLIVCDTTKEASEIKDLLEEEKLTYKISPDGYTITILREQLSDATLLLGANSIPTYGYDIANVFDGGFSSTEADKDKKYKFYCEEKIATDLAALDMVDAASVNLSIPENDGTLIAEDEESYANVMLTLNEDIEPETAASLARFVATALGNTSTENIVILDSQGTLLFSGEDDASSSGSASNRLSYKQQYETLVKNEIKDALVLSKIYDNVQVVPNLDLDWSIIKQTEHTYTPADGQSQGVLSHEETFNSESTAGDGGVPGTDANTENTYVIQDNANTYSTQDEQSRDYLPNETITDTENPGGAINYDGSSLGITAIHYVIYKEDDLRAQGLLDGITFDEYQAANAERVKTTVDDDIYNVVAKATGIDIANISIVAYDEPIFQESEGGEFGVADIMQIVLIVLILGLLGFVVIRSMRSEKQVEQEEELSLDTLLQSTQDARELEDIDMEGKSEVRMLIEKFVDENPEAVASLLRNWLNDDWG